MSDTIFLVTVPAVGGLVSNVLDGLRLSDAFSSDCVEAAFPGKLLLSDGSDVFSDGGLFDSESSDGTGGLEALFDSGSFALTYVDSHGASYSVTPQSLQARASQHAALVHGVMWAWVRSGMDGDADYANQCLVDLLAGAGPASDRYGAPSA